jgi:pimeloyl-ACP methyl ester carboxylesterase
MFARIRTTLTALISATASLFVTSAAFAVAPHEDISFNAVLRGTGSVSIHADVYNNTECPGVVTILAVHGLAERGSMWSPLASAIFADDALGHVVKRIVAIDMPAHGLSGVPSLPSPLLFQDLLIEDNASVLIQSIDALRGMGKGPQIVIGHSMGGLETQTAQEQLLAQGSSYLKHGVVGAILLDAVPANGTQWTQPPPNSGTAQFIFTDPVLGTILGLPPQAGPFTGAFNRISDGALVPGTPSVDTFVANNWVGPEPITTLLELIGTSAPLWRPFVRQNAFQLRNGTVLSVIAGAQDFLTPQVDQPILYTYLTGLSATGVTLYRPVNTDDSVHSMYISNPTGLLDALKNGVIH